MATDKEMVEMVRQTANGKKLHLRWQKWEEINTEMARDHCNEMVGDGIRSIQINGII